MWLNCSPSLGLDVKQGTLAEHQVKLLSHILIIFKKEQLLSELNRKAMTAGVYTEEGVEVIRCESLDMAKFSAGEKNKQAQLMGLAVRYEARAL